MAESKMLAKQTSIQYVTFSQSDDSYESDNSVQLHGKVVNIQCSPGNHNHGNSKVKLNDRSNFTWEFKYYHGHLVAAHVSGKIFAYSMKNKDGGLVKVVCSESDAKKALIKNLKGDVKDLAFSYSATNIILGFVDSEANIYVYNIEELPDSLNCALIKHIRHDSFIQTNTNFKIVWCPYIPSMEDNQDLSDDSDKMFVVLNGKRAEVYNIATLTKKYPELDTLHPEPSHEGYTEIILSSDITDATFSSDGCALAVACKDGYVKFFQLFVFDPDYRKCIHEWVPHDGKALNSVIFLDNFLNYTTQCWKFAVTGAENNTEIKLWSCENWTCLQTINFHPNPNGIPNLFFNMAVDYTGNYVVISDINNRALYVIELYKNETQQLVSAGFITQFVLPAPFISFHILEAGTKNISYCFDSSSEDMYESTLDAGDDFDDDDVAGQSSVLLKMLIIQPKKFQVCSITFNSHASTADDFKVATVDDLIDLTNGMVKLETEENLVKEELPELDELKSSVNLLIQQQEQSTTKLTLMTPDDFTCHDGPINDDSVAESKEKVEAFQKPPKENVVSTESSPSREVEEILSLNNSTSEYPTQDYFNNILNLPTEEEQCAQKDSSVAKEKPLFNNSLNWPKVSIDTDRYDSQDLIEYMGTINLQISAMENTIKEQSIMLQQFVGDFRVLAQSLSGSSARNSMKGIEEMTNTLDATMSNNNDRIFNMVENLLLRRERELKDNLAGLVNNACDKLQSDNKKNIHLELERTFLPSMNKLSETVTFQLKNQNDRIKNMDSIIKENVSRALTDKYFVESISKSITNNVALTLEESLKHIIVRSVVPSMEKVSKEMFHQIQDTFTKGTKEYTASVETYMEKQRQGQDKSKDVIHQMQAASDTFKKHTDKLVESMTTQIHHQLSTVFKGLQDGLASNIKDIVKAEMKQGLESQVAKIEEGVLNAVNMSRTVTPLPQVDPTAQTMTLIQQALAEQSYGEAFQLALSAENLNLVIFVCNHVNVDKIFNHQCMLPQSVLLALIQQLSLELHKNTDIKLRFIKAAFLSLSPADAQTKRYVPKVLQDLLKLLKAYLQANPPTKHISEIRMLMMAVENTMGKFVNA